MDPMSRIYGEGGKSQIGWDDGSLTMTRGSATVALANMLRSASGDKRLSKLSSDPNHHLLWEFRVSELYGDSDASAPVKTSTGNHFLENTKRIEFLVALNLVNRLTFSAVLVFFSCPITCSDFTAYLSEDTVAHSWK